MPGDAARPGTAASRPPARALARGGDNDAVGMLVDLSEAAARAIGIDRAGIARVAIIVLP